jgi:prepilin-type N-terminal cleavage/methylation domain-containing protein
MARRGFTLIELAIVLVIIGLLVGGVFAGRELMHAQKLRNALQDAKAYAIAKQLFLDKYSALPGDMPMATRVWGNADGGGDPTVNCATPDTDVSVGKLTCNGDGNGVIEPGGASGNEVFRAWQQLSAAEMIPGAYTGISGPNDMLEAIPGINAPRTALAGAVFAFESWGPQAGDTQYYVGDYNNIIIMGGVRPSSPYGPILTGAEALMMDTKLDNGLPGLGGIRTFAQTWMDINVGRCVSSDAPEEAAYIATSEAPTCFLLFMSNFQAKPE